MGLTAYQQQLMDKIKSDMHKALEERFLGKPVDQISVNNIHAMANIQALSLLHSNNAGHLKEHIQFDTSAVSDKETVCVNPHNFFTALLFHGIFCYEALNPSYTEHKTDNGTFKWYYNGLGFLPNEPLEHITITFNPINPHPSV